METEAIRLPLGLLFMLLFTLCGPIKMLPTFAGLTAQLPPSERRSLAIRAAGLAALGIALAALLGNAQTAKVGIGREALGTAAGLLMALVGLQNLLGTDRRAAPAAAPDALSIAFPVIMPPHAFGLIILFSLYAQSSSDTIGIIATGAVLMALNLVAMLVAQPVMRRVGMTPLKLFGAVFGIVQLALGLQIIFWGVSHGLAAAPAA